MPPMRAADWLIALLMCYFILMNVTVERYYCQGPLVEGDQRPLVQETIEFCRENNPLFLARPEWLVTATCFSAYGFAPFYALILVVAVTGAWGGKARAPILCFLGAKIYALLIYHWSEFTSAMPPKNLVPYFGVEGPYLVSFALVLMRLVAVQSSPKEKAG